MAQLIGRMYDSFERAAQAAAVLRSNDVHHFPDVFVVSRDAGPDAAAAAGSSPDGLMASLLEAHVLKAHARVYAEGIRRGGTLVVVHARFGTAVLAIDLMEQFGPIDSGVADFKDPPRAWDEAAPCSSVLQLPVLLANSATFSRFWNVPTLLKRAATTFSALGIPELSDTRGPYAGTFGMPLLSPKVTILSSMLGLPLLLKPRVARR